MAGWRVRTRLRMGQPPLLGMRMGLLAAQVTDDGRHALGKVHCFYLRNPNSDVSNGVVGRHTRWPHYVRRFFGE